MAWVAEPLPWVRAGMDSDMTPVVISMVSGTLSWSIITTFLWRAQCQDSALITWADCRLGRDGEQRKIEIEECSKNTIKEDRNANNSEVKIIRNTNKAWLILSWDGTIKWTDPYAETMVWKKMMKRGGERAWRDVIFSHAVQSAENNHACKSQGITIDTVSILWIAVIPV